MKRVKWSDELPARGLGKYMAIPSQPYRPTTTKKFNLVAGMTSSEWRHDKTFSPVAMLSDARKYGKYAGDNE